MRYVFVNLSTVISLRTRYASVCAVKVLPDWPDETPERIAAFLRGKKETGRQRPITQEVSEVRKRTEKAQETVVHGPVSL